MFGPENTSNEMTEFPFSANTVVSEDPFFLERLSNPLGKTLPNSISAKAMHLKL